MVLQRRLDNGFDGYQVPVVPRASRSVRGRGPIRKKCGDNQIRAFEILASVAGTLLQKGESSASSSTFGGKDQFNAVKDVIDWDQETGGQFMKADPSNRKASSGKSSVCVPNLRGHHSGNTLNKFSNSQDNLSFKRGLDSENLGYSNKVYVAKKLAAVNYKDESGSPSTKVDGFSPRAWNRFGGKLEGVTEREPEAELLNIHSIETGTFPHKDRLENAMDVDRDHPAHVPSESNVKTSLFRDCMVLGHIPGRNPDIKVVSRDNDEKSFDSSHHGTMVKTYRPLSYIGGRRIRNLSGPRHWKVTSNLKSGGYYRADRKTRPISCGGRASYSHETSQKIFPFKKRKFFYQNQLSTLDGAYHRDDIYNPSQKRTNVDNCGSAVGELTSIAGQQESPDRRGCNVKLSIKSFKVPELFIEIPATETVGSLKRSVMEAVTAILGDGLHVGILLQGKRVRDDTKTLLQTGISEDDTHGSLGFMLEPKHVPIAPPVCTKNHPLQSASLPGGLNRHGSLTQQSGSSSVSPIPPENDFGNHLGSDPGEIPSMNDNLADNKTSDCRAIVPVPAIAPEALAVVPLNRKSKHLEFGQRRIRRPFSVSEVEALVQAVEKLGTGRWRDVKLRAFDSAHHRTYVDLKDKWKTLVHTATISPQQRRGEPVPQELLDRVLAADAHWSQRQARLQVKSGV